MRIEFIIQFYDINCNIPVQFPMHCNGKYIYTHINNIKKHIFVITIQPFIQSSCGDYKTHREAGFNN